MSRVLVVDDDAGVAFGLERLLARDGHSVRVVPDAEQALASLGESTFDVVLLDLRLPGMTGQEAQRVCRRRWPDLPVIVLSAHGTSDTVREVLAAGASGFLAKPVSVVELRRAVAGAALWRDPHPCGPKDRESTVSLPSR